jgi:hypothetical protein
MMRRKWTIAATVSSAVVAVISAAAMLDHVRLVEIISLFASGVATGASIVALRAGMSREDVRARRAAPPEPTTAGGWAVLATYASGFEADLAMAQLESAEIPALRDSNDTVGIFGPGFQGPTARGVTVRVPASALEEARAVVTLVDGTN